MFFLDLISSPPSPGVLSMCETPPPLSCCQLIRQVWDTLPAGRWSGKGWGHIQEGRGFCQHPGATVWKKGGGGGNVHNWPIRSFIGTILADQRKCTVRVTNPCFPATYIHTYTMYILLVPFSANISHHLLLSLSRILVILLFQFINIQEYNIYSSASCNYKLNGSVSRDLTAIKSAINR
jgi:hypothetical protein